MKNAIPPTIISFQLGGNRGFDGDDEAART
jgi:hypothetical protein